MSGFVCLIGAGLGDPELLTVKATHRLEKADLLLYDALVAAEVVAIAGRAQRFCVGKRASRGTIVQATINDLMIRSARKGKCVVRLKCGDPFVLGRGGEEALALSTAGVPFEVIPGVTSAVAAPGLAGIPVTHRGIASGFMVISGHSEATFGPLLDGISPHAMTIVVLMGLASRAGISERLLRKGWRSQTPVAIIFAAGTPRMRTWEGQLDELGEADIDMQDQAPATIVIGDVVGLRPSINAGRPTLPKVEAMAQGHKGHKG